MQATKNSGDKRMLTGLNLVEDLVANVISQVSSLHQIEDQVEGISILEGKVHIDNKGRGELGEQHPLVHDTLDALLGHNSRIVGFLTWTSASTSLRIGFWSFCAPFSRPSRSRPCQ